MANRNITLKRNNAGTTEELYPTTDWSQINNKPSTFAPTSHTHGNITNGGEITASATIATGDHLVIADNSSGNDLTTSSITFDTSNTTDFLRKDGTFATISTSSGDITGVTAGNGLTGGATSGNATLNVGAGTGISVAADSVSVNTSILNNTHTTHSASNLAIGWYTIATVPGDRGIARFALRDTASGRHQSVVFYAAHHYGTDASNTITVLHQSSYGTTPFRYIRIKEGGTYDGAALQVYIDGAGASVNVYMLGDNFQSSGWTLKDWIADATDPGNVSNYSSFVERGKIDLDQITQGGIATTGQIYAGGDTTQYKVFHDAYHPNADKWTNARTITLGGDLSGSVSLDGSANVTLSAAVANDSHTHDGRYYTETETNNLLAAKAPLASPALTGTPTAPTAAANTNTTQIATTAYVQGEITDLIGGAPGALDTLNELAAAINDDSSYASTITTALAGKVAKSGDTMTGNFTTTSGNNGGIYIGSGGSNITSVTPSSKDIVIQDVSQIRFGSASWDWNSWAGLAFNDSTEVLTIGGPASSVFSSNTNPPSIDVNFDGLNSSGLKVNNNTVWHAGNDGASSGLDADLLDGNHASDFVAVTGDTMTGTLTISNSLPKIQFTDTNNDSDFHIANNNGVLEIADTTNQTARIQIASNGNITLPASGGITLVDKPLQNNSGALTWDTDEVYHEGHKPTYTELGTMAYSNLTGTPTIPTNNNQLTNGAGYVTGSHSHSTSNITSGEFNTARLGSGTATSGYVLKSDGDGTASWQVDTDTNTTYSAGSGLSLSGTTFSHTDTSSQASVNNSGNTFIQDITLDTYGHITAITSATATSSGGNTWTEIKTGSTTITGGTTATNVSLGSNSVDDTTVLAIELNAGSVLSYTSQIFIVKLEDSSNTNAGILFNAGANSSSIYTGSLRIYRTLSMGPTSTSITFAYSYNHINGSSAETADTVYVGKIWKLGVTGS